MFEFYWPWIFILTPLPWVLRWILPAATHSTKALKVDFLPELQAIEQSNLSHKSISRLIPLIFFTLIWLLLLTAAAKPQWVGNPIALPTTGRDLLMAVDVSNSMQIRDMQWNGQSIGRLTLVKHLMGDFITKRTGDKVGLILFGSKAYLQAPLTFDRKTIRTWLKEALVGIAGSQTAIGDAIGLAVKHLRKKPAKERTLILVTDGANTGGEITPIQASKLAEKEHIKIYTIGIGADPHRSMSDRYFGSDPSLALDESTLKIIAEKTKGQYFRVKTSEDLAIINKKLNKLEPVKQEAEPVRPIKPLYFWPLSIAMILSLFLAVIQLLPNWITTWHTKYRAKDLL